MKKEIIEKLPQWHKEINSDNGVILTGDIDSLIGYYYLHKKFGCHVEGFYNFKEVYFNTNNRNNLIGIDMDTIPESRVFGNHLTYFYKNENAINLNNIFNLKYYQKYPFSTTLLILSLYDFDLENFTDEQLKILLAIDVGFKGYYTDNQFFKDVYLGWLDRLDIRFLEDRILNKYARQEMYNVIKKYNLHGTIGINKEGYLKTNIDLDSISKIFNDIIELPQEKFNLHRSYEYRIINPNYQAIPPREAIISMAWTDKNTLKLTLK